jgi:hypothetical protein
VQGVGQADDLSVLQVPNSRADSETAKGLLQIVVVINDQKEIAVIR